MSLPEGWDSAPLEKLCVKKPQSGGTPLSTVQEYYENGTIPWAIIEDLTAAETYIEKTKKNITKLGVANSSVRLFSKGTLLFAMYGSIGAMAISKIDLTANQAILGINPDENLLLTKYLYYHLQYRKKELIRKGRGGTQQNLNAKMLKELIIYYPKDLKEQREIVAILEKTERIKQKRQQQIEAFEKHAQSVFLEMFGDPRFNPKYPSKTLNEVCVKITDGTHKTPVYVDDGIPFLRVTDITNSNESKKFLTKEEHTQLTQRCKPEKGDVLYTKNETVGIAKMVDWNYEFSIFVSLCLLKPRKDIISAKYLETFLNTPIALEQALHRSKKGTITNLHLNQIKMIKLPLPPMELQEEFAGIIRKIEATCQKQQQTKMHEENLFDCLMQKAFNGDLT